MDEVFRKSILERAGFRCEWEDIDFTRCRNAMSLKLHHRTYDRYHHEKPDDLTVFCSKHHMLADVIRKQFIGASRSHIETWFQRVAELKINNVPIDNAMKFTIGFKNLTIDYIGTQRYLDYLAENRHSVLDAIMTPPMEDLLAMDKENADALLGNIVDFWRYFSWNFLTLRRCAELPQDFMKYTSLCVDMANLMRGKNPKASEVMRLIKNS